MKRHAAIFAVGGVAVAALFLQRSPAQNPPPTSQPTTQPLDDRPIPETKGPITYYVQHCARCHGDISAAYIGIKHPKRGAELRKVIADMATGPAQAPLEDAALDEQTKLHEAMFDDKPYAWLDRNQKPAVVEQLENTDAALVNGNTTDTPARTDDYRAEFHWNAGKLVITKRK